LILAETLVHVIAEVQVHAGFGSRVALQFPGAGQRHGDGRAHLHLLLFNRLARIDEETSGEIQAARRRSQAACHRQTLLDLLAQADDVPLRIRLVVPGSSEGITPLRRAQTRQTL
jgi:hypothetical protein